MVKKKINSKMYTDAPLGKSFTFEELMEIKTQRFLYSKGTYKTKLKEEDLPDYFVSITHWQNFYYDVSKVQDIVYIPNRLIGNNTLKYDKLLISYDKDIKMVKKDYNDDYTADWDTYDVPFDGYHTREILPVIEKYNPHLKEKIDKIWEVYYEREKEVEEVRKEEQKGF